MILFAPTLVLALVLVVVTWLRLPPWTDATKASFFVLAVVAAVVAAVRGCRTSGRDWATMRDEDGEGEGESEGSYDA